MKTKLVRIALWIGCILFALPIAMATYLSTNFGIELGFWAIVSTYFCFVLASLLIIEKMR